MADEAEPNLPEVDPPTAEDSPAPTPAGLAVGVNTPVDVVQGVAVGAQPDALTPGSEAAEEADEVPFEE